MGSRSDDAHVAGEYIQELRKFIEVRISEEPAHAGDPGIIIRSLLSIGFRVDVHRPEFKTGEGTAKKAYPFLHEKDRTAGIQFDEDIEDGKQPAEYEDENENVIPD